MPFGGLVENQQRRLEHERAADGELLLLPTRKIAASPLPHCLQHRKQIEDLRRNRARAVLAERRARHASSLPPSAAERSRALAARSRCRGAPALRAAARADRCSSNAISPDVAGSSPMMHLSSVVLPIPLRPIRHVRDPSGTVEIDVPQRVAAAVELVEAVDLQHAHVPDTLR